MPNKFHPSRREVIAAGALASGGLGLILAGGRALAQDSLLPATPACGDDHSPTLEQIEGPFYKPRSPARADLTVKGGPRPVVELSGFVVTRSCRPIAHALVDLWHADETGDYDNRGFRYRGHVFTDAQGRYRFRTIVPAEYPGRTRHYHVKVHAPGQRRLLTTQLYFPNEPSNGSDGFFRRELLMRIGGAGDGLAAQFDFVLDIG